MKNWKTNACGLVVALATAIAPCLSDQWRPVALSLAGLATAIGFAVAKDAGRTPPTDPPAAQPGA